MTAVNLSLPAKHARYAWWAIGYLSYSRDDDSLDDVQEVLSVANNTNHRTDIEVSVEWKDASKIPSMMYEYGDIREIKDNKQAADQYRESAKEIESVLVRSGIPVR